MVEPVLGFLALCLALVVLIENLQKSLISIDLLLISLFENYDYRICFLFIAFKYIVENKNESVFLLYMTIILTSATYFSLSGKCIPVVLNEITSEPPNLKSI